MHLLAITLSRERSREREREVHPNESSSFAANGKSERASSCPSHCLAVRRSALRKVSLTSVSARPSPFNPLPEEPRAYSTGHSHAPLTMHLTNSCTSDPFLRNTCASTTARCCHNSPSHPRAPASHHVCLPAIPPPTGTSETVLMRGSRPYPVCN